MVTDGAMTVLFCHRRLLRRLLMPFANVACSVEAEAPHGSPLIVVRGSDDCSVFSQQFRNRRLPRDAELIT